MDKKGTKNMVANDLSRLSDVRKEELPLDDYFHDDKLVALIQSEVPWYDDFFNHLAVEVLLLDMKYQQKT